MARGARLILDRYEPLGTAGVGGFGTVEIAWDPRIQRKVAIKTIKLTEHDAYRAYLPGAQAVSGSPTADRWHGALPWDEYLESEEAYGGADAYAAERGPDDYDYDRDDFADGFDTPDGPDGFGQVTSLSHLPGLDEARTAAMLADPRIVTVYDFEIRDRFAYLIMEYIEGITLTRLLADYGDVLTLDMVTAVFDAMAGALTTAHKAGVLHLDMKPDNIIINAQGQAKVTDFGLATLADASGAGTTGGGTIGYMPLEQMRREHLDARTDEWSLAAVAYEMLTGYNPFRVGTLDEAEAAIEDAELVLPSLCWDNLDGQLDDVLFYALDPDREERYASVADFAEEADKFLGDAAQGRDELSLVVADALGLLDEEDEDDGWEEDDPGLPDVRRPFGAGRLGVIADLLASSFRGADDDGGRFDDDGVPYEQERTYAREDVARTHERRERRERREHVPLARRIDERVSNVAGRVFAAAGSGLVAWLALSNMPFVPTAFGAGTAFTIAVGVAVVAAIAAIVPLVGALVPLVVLGATIVACGHPVVGAILMAVAAVWWFLVGRNAMACSNVALSLPVAGAVGGSSAVPFLAGAVLSLVPALATTVLVAVEALVFGSLGSGSLLGWDALAHWSFTRVDITGNLLMLVKRASTWAVIASWLVATASLSLAFRSGKGWVRAIGTCVALAVVLAVGIVFLGPSAQLIVSAVLAAAVLVVFFV